MVKEASALGDEAGGEEEGRIPRLLKSILDGHLHEYRKFFRTALLSGELLKLFEHDRFELTGKMKFAVCLLLKPDMRGVTEFH